jgi:hypothetical protein
MKPIIQAGSILAALSLGALLFSGCSTVIKQSYEGYAPTSNLKVASFSGSTAVYGSTAPEEDGRKLVGDDYAKLGTSTFSSGHLVKFEELQSEANDVGADIVLFAARNPGTQQYLKPMALNDAGTPYTLAPYANASSNPGGNYANATDLMPISNGQEYEYLITFWRKAPKS